MGDNYSKKIELLAKSKDVKSVSKVCESCSQLEFDHRPGACTRSANSDKEKYTPEQIAEIVAGVSQDVLDAIMDNSKVEMQSSLSNVQTFGSSETLASAFNNLAEVLKLQRQTPAQVTKVKIPPVWIKESFSDFKAEVTSWEKAHPGDEYTKYCELLNELKRNKVRAGLSDYVSTVIIEKTRDVKTVSEILKLLEDKYELSKKEKFENLVSKLKSFKPSKNESGEQILVLMEKLDREFQSLELGKNLYYFLVTLCLKELFENDVINEIEKQAMQDLISTKNEAEIMNVFLKEFKKIKVEGKREADYPSTESTENKTYYVNNKSRSRYDAWKGSRDFKDFKRTNSNNWRTFSNNRWRKAQSQSASRSRPRSVSLSKDKDFDFRSMKEFQDIVIKELKSLKEKQNEMTKIQNDMIAKVVDSKYIETDYIEEDWSKENVKIYFTNHIEEVDEMVVDCGAPKTLIGEKYLVEYMHHHKLDNNDLEKIPCKQKFKFGPSQIFISTEKAIIPICFKVRNGFVRKSVEAFVIKADVPFLLGLNTMKQWRVLIDMECEEMCFRIFDFNVKMSRNVGGHLTVPLQKVEEWSTTETVLFMKNEDQICTFDKIKKVHENTNHKSEENLLHAYREANLLNDSVRKLIKKVCDNCKICQKFKKSQSKPKVALPKVTDFNQVVTLDLKQFDGRNVLWAVDSFTRFIQGIVISNKKAETVVEAISSVWCLRFGYPNHGFWADNGSEFQNKEMCELMSKLGLRIEFGAAYSPWSNGINERNHYSADTVVRKVLETNKRLGLQKAVDLASWTHNTNISVLGYEPMRLVTGKSVNLPGISVGNDATESLFDSEAVQKIMERHQDFVKKFREVEYSEKIKKAALSRSSTMNNIFYKEGDEVFYQDKDKVAWNGPAKVFCQKGREVYIFANGHIKKLHACKVKPFKCYSQNENIVDKEVRMNSDVHDNNDVEMKKNDDLVILDENEMRKDTVGTFWMVLENTECFNEEITSYVVELPSSKHNIPEVVEAKKSELKNLADYETFEEVEDCGQERISSRWVITMKEAHDGQKKKYKARLVARGFQENIPPQSDSPTVLRESNKLFSAVAANQEFKLVSVDIRAAFLQSKELKREVYVVPPKDISEPGKLWRLKKPLYGLNDASRRFWLRVKEVFKEENMQTLPGDEAFYFENVDGVLNGMIISHVDDFQIAGTDVFIEKIMKKLESNLTISKVERNEYRFTGIDVKRVYDGVELSMADYAGSMQEITELRRAKKDELLTKSELKLYRKFVGKLNWLAENTRPDLAIWALNLSKTGSKATIGDLKKLNRVIKKVSDRQSKVKFTHIGNKQDLVLHAIGDASFKSDGPSVGGQLIMLGNKTTSKVSPLFWKSRQIKHVCHSAKEAETRNVMKLVDTAVYLGEQLSALLFGNVACTIPLHIYTDSKPLLDSIASTKQVEQRLLRNTMTDLKEKLERGLVTGYSWVDTRSMTADILTKEGGDLENILEVVRENVLRIAHSQKNRVIFKHDEIMMTNEVKNEREFDQESILDQTRAGGE